MSTPRWLDWIQWPFWPLSGTLRDYDLGKLRRDATAGLTVAVVEVPQSMAYALVAGVPPQIGLYTSIVQGFVAALFSSNERLATGPTNTQSLLVAAVVSRVVAERPGATDPELYLQLVFGLALLKGLCQLAFAAAGMGTLLRYVSHGVVVGFTAGAGILIAVGQAGAFLGLPSRAGAAFPGMMPGVIGPLRELAAGLGQIDPRAAGIGIGTLVILFGLRRLAPRLPEALIALVVVAAVTRLAGWDAAGLAVVGDLPARLPGFALPQIGLREVEWLMGGALALATLGTIETVSIGKSLAARTGDRIRADRELLAQGLANSVGAFLQNLPGSGSFTRTALNFESGGATRIASMLSAVGVAAILLLLAPLAGSIPLAGLAGLLLAVAYRLVDLRFILRLLRSVPGDGVVCLTTLVCTLLAPLQYAIFIGIFLNVALYLRKASRLHMTEMRSTSGGAYEEQPLRDGFGRERVLFLQIEGGLFFGLADELRDRLARVVGSGVQVVVLRLKRTHMVDATILLALEEFVRGMRRQERSVVLCGIQPELLAMLEQFGLVELIGRENVFESSPGVFSSARLALARAEEIVGARMVDPSESGATSESASEPESTSDPASPSEPASESEPASASEPEPER